MIFSLMVKYILEDYEVVRRKKEGDLLGRKEGRRFFRRKRIY